MTSSKTPYICVPEYHSTDEGKLLRYVLKPATTGTKPLFVIGRNPNNANENGLDKDPTIQNIEQFAEKNGFSHFVMFNLCPLRTPKSDTLPEIISTNDPDNKLLAINIGEIEKELNKAPTIFACWGTTLFTDSKFKGCRPYFIESLHRLFALDTLKNAHWVRIKSTYETQFPLNPVLRNLNKEFFTDDFELQDWNWDEIESYLKDCEIPFSNNIR